MHLAVVPDMSGSLYQFIFSIDFSLLWFCSGNMGCHVVFFCVVAASREPSTAAGHLASSKYGFTDDEVFHRRSPARLIAFMLITLFCYLIFTGVIKQAC